MSREISLIILHCTATPQTTTIASIQNYWRNVLGWKNPGYHILISPDGIAHRLNDDQNISNGVARRNANSIHISYIGGVAANGKAIDNRTTEQRQTMQRLVFEYLAKYPNAKIAGHNQFANKACPSFDVPTYARSLGVKENRIFI